MFSDFLKHKIPLQEAADYFMKMKYAGYQDPPDETGQFEGQYDAPVEQVVAAISEMAQSKLRIAMAYRIYSETLRDPSNSALGDHFKEHSDNELDAADYFLRRAAVLMGPVQMGEIETPPATTDLNEILRILIRAEQEAIVKLRALRDMLGENPMKYEVEQMLSLDLHHIDDMWQHIPHSAGNSAPIAKTASAGPSVERFLPGTDHHHGPVMKLALQHLRPTVFVPAPEAEEKTASYKWASMVPPPPPPAAPPSGAGAGQQQPMMPQPPLAGAAAGEHAKMAALLDNNMSFLKKTAGYKSDSEVTETGKQRAMLNAVARAENTKHTRGERIGGVSGSLLGATGGALAAHGLKGDALAKAVGALTGSMLGGKVGKEVGREVDRVRIKKANDELAALQQEQQATVATDRAEADFYRQRYQAAAQELQMAQQQASQAGEQVQQLQQQVDQGKSGMQQALDQANQIQQSAMANVQAAHNVATQQAQTSMQKSQELIHQLQMSADARNSLQSMKEQLMQVAMAPAQPITPSEASGAAMQQQAQVAAGSPTALQPGEVGPDANTSQGQGAESPLQNAAPTAALGQTDQQKVGFDLKSLNPNYVGAAAGALLGGVGTAIESQMPNDKLRDKVRMLHEEEQLKGPSFTRSMDMAQTKVRLGLSEVSEKHPVAATAAGTILGGLSGMKMGPALIELARMRRG
jgi:bacterioferritin (cytochrome b1)